ncbi:MAG: hypothetical protein IJV27_01855 [Prevotella sp.]|nr:hypothetical protein [Prevotella sp.]
MRRICWECVVDDLEIFNGWGEDTRWISWKCVTDESEAPDEEAGNV